MVNTNINDINQNAELKNSIFEGMRIKLISNPKKHAYNRLFYWYDENSKKYYRGRLNINDEIVSFQTSNDMEYNNGCRFSMSIEKYKVSKYNLEEKEINGILTERTKPIKDIETLNSDKANGIINIDDIINNNELTNNIRQTMKIRLIPNKETHALHRIFGWYDENTNKHYIGRLDVNDNISSIRLCNDIEYNERTRFGMPFDRYVKNKQNIQDKERLDILPAINKEIQFVTIDNITNNIDLKENIIKNMRINLIPNHTEQKLNRVLGWYDKDSETYYIGEMDSNDNIIEFKNCSYETYKDTTRFGMSFEQYSKHQLNLKDKEQLQKNKETEKSNEKENNSEKNKETENIPYNYKFTTGNTTIEFFYDEDSQEYFKRMTMSNKNFSKVEKIDKSIYTEKYNLFHKDLEINKDKESKDLSKEKEKQLDLEI